MSMTQDEIKREKERRDKLSAQKNQAGVRDLTTYEKNYLVEAGAGAGKTYIMVERIVNQLIETGLTPLQIVAITFTKKATQELQERMSDTVFARLQAEQDPERKKKLQSIFDQLGQMQISTIHGFCQTMLNAMPFETVLGLDWTLSEPDGRNAKAFFEGKLAERHPLAIAAEKRHLDSKKLYATFERLCVNSHMNMVYTDVSDQNYKDCRDRVIDMVKDPTAKWPAENGGPKVSDSAYHRALSPYVGLRADEKYLLHPDFLQLVNQPNPTDDDCLRLIGFMEGSLWGIMRPYNSTASRVVEEKKSKEGVIDPDLVKKYTDLIAAIGKFESCQASTYCKSIRGEFKHLIHCELMPHLVDLAHQYSHSKVEEKRADYNDLLRYTRELLRNSDEARAYFHDRYRAIYVDEFQDTDPLQAELLFYLASADDARSLPRDWKDCKLRPGNLFFVGDPKQAIYRFRSADISIYNRVKQNFADRQKQGGAEEVVNLQFNYRSDKAICDYVDRAFGPGGDVGSRLDGGEYQAEYVAMEAVNNSQTDSTCCNGVYSYQINGNNADEHRRNDPKQVAAFIHTMVDGGVTIKTKKGICPVQYKDFLVLTAKDRVESYVEELAKRGIPVVASGVQKLSEVSAIQLALDILRGLAYPNDSITFVLLLTQQYNVTLPTIRRFLALADSRYIADLRNEEKRKLVLDQLSGNNEDQQVAELCRAGAELESFYNKSRYLPPMATVELVMDYAFTLRTPGEAHNLQGDYSLMMQMCNDIRSKANGSLAEVYELAQICSETSIEHHLALQPQENVVRLMNPHKAKGLEGKIVILASQGKSDKPPESHAKREGIDINLYQCIVSKGNGWGGGGSVYGTPFGWESKKGANKATIMGTQALEKEYLDAEKKRILYVAATRAECMLLIAEAPVITASKAGPTTRDNCVWKPLRAVDPANRSITAGYGSFSAPMQKAVVALSEGEEYIPTATDPASAGDDTQVSMADLPTLQQVVSQSSRFAISPSRLDGEAPRPKPPTQTEDSDTATTLVVVDTNLDGDSAQDAVSAGDTAGAAAAPIPKKKTSAYTAPYGAHWGTIIHRVLELAVRSGDYTADALAEYSRQAIWETLTGAVLSQTQSAMLYGDTPVAQRGDWLLEKVCQAVQFASDGQSPFRQLVAEGTALPELAFFAAPAQGEFYDHLQQHISAQDGAAGKVLDVQGFIDLAIHTPHGWVILDYKTNQQRPGQSDSKFDHHMADKYRSQLEAYSKLLEEETGEKTLGCYLCAIHAGGRLIDLDKLPPKAQDQPQQKATSAAAKSVIAPAITPATAITTANTNTVGIAGMGTPLAEIVGPYTNTEQFTLYLDGTAVLLADKKGVQSTTVKKCKTFVIAAHGWLSATYPSCDFDMSFENRGADALMTMLIKKMRKVLPSDQQSRFAIDWQKK